MNTELLLGGRNARKYKVIGANPLEPFTKIIFPNNGCKITDLRRSDYDTNPQNWVDSAAGHADCAGEEFTSDDWMPLVCDDGFYWTICTTSAGTFWGSKSNQKIADYETAK